jgi:uncharacterized protein involved in cysteine biosynthesis
MIQAFTIAFLQLRDPRIFKFVLLCIVITIIVYLTLFVGLGWALQTTTLTQLPWLDTLLDLGVGIGAAILAWLLFPGVVTSVMALFLERVAEAIEQRSFPNARPARTVPLMESVSNALRLLAYTVGLNLLCLPLYLVFLFIPPLNLLLFYGLNGTLLGREYFETVALRHHDSPTVAGLRRQFKMRVLGAGAITTALLTIPGVNLVAPIVGIGAMVHLFHKLTHSSVELPRSTG